MLRDLLLAISALLAVSATATEVRLPPEEYLRESTLIAILHVGQIHRAVTPEGILVESATATIEKVIWYEFGAFDKLPDNITLYNVFPGSYIVQEHIFLAIDEQRSWFLKQGRIFAMLKERGPFAFASYDRLSIQEIGPDETILWPTAGARKRERIPISRVTDELDKLIKSHAQIP